MNTPIPTNNPLPESILNSPINSCATPVPVLISVPGPVPVPTSVPGPSQIPVQIISPVQVPETFVSHTSSYLHSPKDPIYILH